MLGRHQGVSLHVHRGRGLRVITEIKPIRIEDVISVAVNRRRKKAGPASSLNLKGCSEPGCIASRSRAFDAFSLLKADNRLNSPIKPIKGQWAPKSSVKSLEAQLGQSQQGLLPARPQQPELERPYRRRLWCGRHLASQLGMLLDLSDRFLNNLRCGNLHPFFFRPNASTICPSTLNFWFLGILND